jgi:hypothetical protein
MGRRRFLSFCAVDRFVGNGIFTDAHCAFVVRSSRHLVCARDVRESQVGIGEVDCEAMRVVCLTGCCSQAREGMWGMPGHTEAMKAVVSCEKLGGVAHTR